MDENFENFEEFENNDSLENYIAEIEEVEIEKTFNLNINTDVQISEIEESNTESSDHYTFDVWHYVNKNDPKCHYCLTCKFIFSSKTSTSSIRDHLVKHNLLTRKSPVQMHSEKEQLEQSMLLVKWIIKAMQPFSIVDDISFCNFLNKLDFLFVILKCQAIYNKILKMFTTQ
ncbi:1023_t:CDS:1 [Cetraspora pellucida]|uniref:1023_t:CDS:1 n=1 Tax=Cetraspora pellucida TaxID=1433469 RepID=A0A9N8VG35_9GLOM|nr:1023_t:CDS:1 [Cetraspora pellucida]